MANPAAERLVKYVLTMELDGAAQQNAAKLPKIVEQAQAEATKIVGQNTKERLEFEKTAFNRITELQKKQLGAAEATHREIAGIAEMMQNEITRKAEEAQKTREQNEKDSLRRIQEEYEKHVATIQQKAREMNDGVVKAGEGLTRLGRGLATVGVLQEETAEEMLRALIAVQASVDAVKGGIEIYRGIQQAVDAYRASVVAATAAETALAAARGRTGAVTGVSGAAQLAGGAGGSVAAAGGNLVPVLGSIGAAIASLPAAIAMAIAGVAGAGAMAFNIGGSRDWASEKMGEGGWFAPGTTSGSVLGGGSWLAEQIPDFAGVSNLGINPLGGVAEAQRGAASSTEQADRMAAQRQSQMEMVQRHSMTARLEYERQRQRDQMGMQTQASLDAMRGGPSLDDVHIRLGTAQSQLHRADQERAKAEAMDASPMRQEAIALANQMQIDAMQKVIQLKQQAFELEKETARTAVEGAKAETAELESQLAIRQAEKDAIEGRLQSAQERFGQMDEATQRRAIAAMQKAQSGDELSREERSLLRSVGTEQAKEFASQGDVAAAEAAGFSNIFGARERARATELSREMDSINVDLTGKQEMLVRLENEKEFVDNMTNQMVDQVEALMMKVQERINQERDRKFNERQAQQNNVFGGGLRAGS